MNPIFIHEPSDYIRRREELKPLIVIGNGGREIKVPCVNTIMVKRSLVQANLYNPNKMPDNKKEELVESIMLAGFAYGVSAQWDDDMEQFVTIDGFHRWLIAGYDYLGMDYIPVVPLDLTPEQRMMATWTFNKARGSHQVDLDAELIRKLIEQGVEEDEIAQRLGIDLETIHRYKQLTGIADLFKNAQYSMSWSIVEVDDAA